MAIQTKSLLENSIFLEEDSVEHPSLFDCLTGALRAVGCRPENDHERNEGHQVHHYSFDGKIIAAMSTWFDESKEEESAYVICRIDLDRDFAKEWWNILAVEMLPTYAAQRISVQEVDSEVYSWEPLTDSDREDITRRCSEEIQKFFAQLD
jgi:hypothetical protein